MTDFPGLEKRETRATRQVSPTEGRTWGTRPCPSNSAKASPNRLMDWICLPIQRIRSHLSARVMQGCHAIRRAFVPVFRAALGFLRASAAGFLVLVAAGFLALATAGFLALVAAGFLALATVGFLALATAGLLALAKAGFLVLAAPGFLVLATVDLLALATASTGAGNSSLGGFGVRWWPWCIGWMRAASSSVRS